MFGKGRNQRNKIQQRGMGTTQIGVCSCPQCNFSMTHKRGIPCHSLVCPKCHIPLIRNVLSENSSNQQVSNNNAKISSFPKIDTELCIGCGACVNKCPSKAIYLEDDKAIITIVDCKKCRICVSVCPAGAIS